ncbi:alpha/beta hydrolase [Streptomyces atratus]|uniref:alpha/beta hydrolase family protein n=1 Tax=Streptomyces atratus TaxID=1893 RepID=UPI0037BC68DF
MISPRSRATATAITLAVLLALPTTASAAPGPATRPDATPAAHAVTGPSLEVPRPTGPYAAGRDTLHLTDRSRPDPWVPAAGARQLMVSVHYPARPGSGTTTAPYMTTDEARLMLASRGLEDVVPATTVSATLTHARLAARPAPGRFPLVVLSPGFGTPRSTLTGLAEDLASRGYVVATVDHAYESTGTTFPGGRLLTCVACERTEGTGRAGLAAVSKGRAADLSFVLDRLTGRHPAWRHARMIDPDRIGMAGHSIGGNATASTMAADHRVRAGVDMDGTFFDPVPAGGLDGRPFLMLGTAADHHPGGEDESWDEGWARLDGWKRWLTVTGSGHFTFTDVPALGGQLGMVDPEAPLSGERSMRITRDYVAAFFDLHLRGTPQPLLDGPTPDNPEVGFQH